ncbi:MAG: DUF2812 domain-containing protein [Lachnospiraceae bacterium]|nr:DUF2812 domain-containing protein [Lachnospiraceae bacterium]
MQERKTIYKWFWAWDFEKEEAWLNVMAASGWVLDRVGFCKYTFVKSEPEEYTVRLEMRNHDRDYLDFMEEIGAEYIGRMAKWIYFRKKAADGRFDIFSDIDSRIQHLDRIGKLLTVVGVLNLIVGIANTFNYVNIGWINLLCATLLMYGLGRIHGKKEALEKDRLLHD